MRDELPLLELFTRLREAGLPLGLADYQAVVKALQGGYGVSDRAALERLCRTLWVRSEDEQRVFEYCFADLMEGSVNPGSLNPPMLGGFEKEVLIKIGDWKKLVRKTWLIPVSMCLIGLSTWVGVTLLAQSYNPSTKPKQSSINSTQPSPVQVPAQPVTASQQPTKPTPNVSPPAQSRSDSVILQLFIVQLVAASMTAIGIILLLRQIQQLRSVSLKQRPSHHPLQKDQSKQLLNDSNEDIQIAKAAKKTARYRTTNPLPLTDYLPVTQRQMKQSWRYLRQFIREGIPTELDVESTVRHIAQNGMLLNPILMPPRRNQTELSLLIDQDGSMVAFHMLSERLVETAMRGGRLGEAGVYYFHNCPIDYLYHDSKHQQAEPLKNLMGKVLRGRSVVLIFSDAGSARGGANPARVNATKQFLSELKLHVRYVVWLNPMPKARWIGTSAEAIAQFVPMYEISRQGLDGAISALRGRGRFGL
jgi:uncharacterized protein